MKKLLTILTIATLTFTGMAQTNKPLFIKGDLNINYNTHQNPPNTKGIQDDYTIDINVANSIMFQGKMTDRPQIIEGWISKAIVQQRSLKYDIDCFVVNPRIAVDKNNPRSVLNVGKLTGFCPIDDSGCYNYDLSTLVMDIVPAGRAAGFSSKISGQAFGKPLTRPSNWADTIRQSVDITKIVGGKKIVITLNRYDKLELKNVVLPVGPIAKYSGATVNGCLYYDYSKNCWFFQNNFTMQYADNKGNIKQDKISGSIRWVKDKNRRTSGASEYQFDIRVNENDTTEGAFAAPATESDFFATDTSINGLSGTFKYLDRIKDDGSEDGVTLSSAVKIDLTGNNISPEQLVILCKTIIFLAVIPFNAD